jgi:hypothetical protein
MVCCFFDTISTRLSGWYTYDNVLGYHRKPQREGNVMPYISEAARELGISDKTLRKWMRLLNPPITTTKHHYDPRYHIISAEDMERIRRARSELPGQSSPVSSS